MQTRPQQQQCDPRLKAFVRKVLPPHLESANYENPSLIKGLSDNITQTGTHLQHEHDAFADATESAFTGLWHWRLAQN
jgi:hypothetical protein